MAGGKPNSPLYIRDCVWGTRNGPFASAEEAEQRAAEIEQAEITINGGCLPGRFQVIAAEEAG